MTCSIPTGYERGSSYVAVERTGEFRGRYHVLHGAISPIDGIGPERLHIRELFARADEARARPGTGLGLSLVDALVNQAGGELRLCHEGRHVTHGRPAPVQCSHGPGMTVTVLLPLVGGLRAA